MVEFNSSQVLRLSLTLYWDLEYKHRFHNIAEFEPEETLFFELAIDQDVNNTFASDVLVEVVSCWTTESDDPDDTNNGILAVDG